MGYLFAYLQHSYNKEVHVFIEHSAFEVCYGYQHLAAYEIPISLPTSYHEKRSTRFQIC